MLVTFDGESKTTDGNGEVSFTAGSVSNDMMYDITATKQGHSSDETEILVTNVPKLVVIIPDDISGGTFEVIVADETGKSIVGANVIFNGKTYTSGANGVVVLPVPEKGEYTLVVEMNGFESVESSPINIAEDTASSEFLLVLIAIGAIACILIIGIAVYFVRKK